VAIFHESGKIILVKARVSVVARRADRDDADAGRGPAEMNAESEKAPLKDRLGNSDTDVWLVVAGVILPRVREGLRWRFGVETRWVSADEAVHSAVRTVLRRLKSGQAASYPLETLDDLEAVLYAIARRKLIDSLRATSREARLAPRVLDRRAGGDGDGDGGNADQISESLLDLVGRLLKSDAERTIFREKMRGAGESAIAETLRTETGVPWSKFMVREAWRRFRARARRRINDLLEGPGG
jgi:DNA-directed RNA polymerase specialized sigma24 family protein